MTLKSVCGITTALFVCDNTSLMVVDEVFVFGSILKIALKNVLNRFMIYFLCFV